jgi:GTP-binding protein HflX
MIMSSKSYYNDNNNKVILITYPYDDSIKEALALADAAGYRVVATVTQRYLMKSKYGIGSGKLDEVKSLIRSLDVKKIIFDEVLKPTQEYNLASELGVEVIDREKLILSIFESRASTAESRIQVKLAQLRYELARAREKVRLAKKGEQPGFYGLGRYEVDDYYRDIKRRISTLKKRLEDVAKRRALYRKQRSREGLLSISLAGYTSAGKTTLFNTLVNERHDTDKGMFTTLSTYTRALMLHTSNGNSMKVLLSDTVGFISKLPAYMIEAFRSTLEELTFADLVLLVIDISEPLTNIMKKYESSVKILNELQVSQAKVFYVLNKMDLVKDYAEITDKAKALGIDSSKYVAVSSKYGKNIDILLNRIRELLDHMYRERIDIKREHDGKEYNIQEALMLDIDNNNIN